MGTNKPSDAPLTKVPVWDWPTRAFHWILVVLIIVAWYSAKFAENAMDYHMRAGIGIIGLVLFRILWGFVGGEHARFASFLRGPGTVLRYAGEMLRPNSPRHLGHNPMGAWSVVAMLLCLAVQAGTGLFANDDISTEGPLYRLVSKETSDFMTRIHHFNINILYVLIGVHLAAIFFYLLKKGENLIRPMITGSKDWHDAAAGKNARGSSITAIVLIIVVAAVVYYVVKKPG